MTLLFNGAAECDSVRQPFFAGYLPFAELFELDGPAGISGASLDSPGGV
jgi:hypothetical protein